MRNSNCFSEGLRIFFILSLLSYVLPNTFAQPLSGILPKYNAFADQPAVIFEWNSMDLAINYTVILSQDDSFSSGLIQSPALTSTTWQSSSLASGIWFWKVVADDGIQQVESNIGKFIMFRPNDLSGNNLWLSGDGDVQLSGSNVVEWTDMSGAGNNFGQATSSDQPAVTNIALLNNKKVIHFDGVSDYLNAGNVLNIGTNSITSFVLSFGIGSIYSKFGSGTAPFNIYSYYNLPTEQGIELAGVNYQNFFTSSATNYHILSFRANRSVNLAQMRRNAIQVSGGPITGLIPLNSYNFTNTNPLLMGRYTMSGSPFFLNGDIAEVIFYNRSLTDSERDTVEAYLSDKYSPGINLGRDTTLTSYCPYILVAPTGYSNLLWSTGESTSTIAVAFEGEYWVRGTNIFGKVSYDTLIVNHPTIPLPYVSAICDGQSLTWNADMGAGWTYLWSTGETTPSITFSNPGTYSVTVTDPFGCSKTSDPAIFGIDNYESSAFLGNDTSLCSGNQVALQVGSMETLEYFWNGNTSAGQQASFVVTASGDVTLESINVNGCVAQDTIQVTVSGVAPNADFSFSDLCGTETGAFTDLSVPAGSDPIATWSWDMGDLTNISTQNASHSYAASGLYTVQLYVESAGGCGDLHIETVNVYLPPTADFSVSGHCEDQQVDFASTSSDGDAAITTWSWNFDMPASGSYNFSSIPVPNRIFPDVATYDVSLVVTDANGCSDSLAQAVVIDPSATVDFNYSLACAGSAIQLTDGSSTLPGSTYNWSWPLGGSILQNPSTTFSAEGSYDVTLQVGNTFGCTSSLTKTIVVNPLPTINLNFGPHCAGTYMDATAVTNIVSGVVDSVQWIFEGTDFLTGANVDYLIQEIGQLEIEATAFSDQGCTSTVSQNLDVTSELYVSFTPEIGTAGAGDIFPFDNTSIGTNVALWNFGDGQFSSEFDANHIYDDQYIDSVMNVYLIGLNTAGCMDTAYGQISVQRPYLDLALEEIFVQAVGEWQIVGVRMRNTGTINVARADLWIETRAGRLVEETWTGLLSPGEDSIYIFTGKVQSFVSEQDVQDDFICVSGEGYNLANGIENDLSNNVACKDIEGEEAVMLPAYPNPADNDLKLQLLISKEETVQLYLSDALGQIVINVLEDQVLTPGLFSYALNLRNLRDGVYFIRMRTATIDLSEKVVVRD